eukprot:scaffold77976_cov18-Tisochrysis_lutea.AAC.1
MCMRHLFHCFPAKERECTADMRTELANPTHTCACSVPNQVGMVVSLLEDAPLEAELAPPTATMGCSTTTDQSIWAASPIRHQDTHTSSDTSSWRQSLHHIPADSDANTATGRSAQCAPLQSSLAGRNAASLADVGGSFPRRNDSQAGQSLWPVKEQGEASRHQRQNIEESEPDHSATEEAR